MKTNRILSAALIVFAATACNSDYISENMTGQNLEPMTIEGIETKTSFNQADGSVKWTAGDQIAIYDNLGGCHDFENTAEAVSTFTGNVTAGTKKFWGIYPSVRVKGFSNGVANVTLPSNQTSKDGSFAEELNISVTTGSKTPGTEEVSGIQFHNVCGMISFDIPARIAASSVTFTAHNRDIVGLLSVNCNDNKATVIEGTGSKEVTMSGTFKKGSRFYFVVAPGTIEGFEIEVKTAKGSTFGRSAGSGKIEVVAGKVTNLKEINFTDGVASADAKHTYDENNQLTGTTLTVNHGIPANMWGDVTELSLTAKKGDVTYREYNVKSVNGETVVNDASVTLTTGNTYLPQGTYTISGSYKMNGEPTQIKEINVTVLAPTGISLTSINGVTSYSLAKGGDVTNANKHQADRIIPMATVSGVSAEVLSEVGLSYTFSLSNGKSVSGTTYSSDIKGAYIDGNAWATHTLTASGTFDGVSVAGNGSSECHITGLPYSVDFDANRKSWLGWTSNGSEWMNHASTAWKLHLNQGFIVSPQFYYPEIATDGINLSAVINCQYYRALAWYSSKSTFEIGSTLNVNTKATEDLDSEVVSYDVYTDVRPKVVNMETRLTPSRRYISLTANEKNSFVFKISLNYR